MVYVHSSGTIAETVTVRNTAAADGFSENLVASVVGVTGAVTDAGGSVTIAAQGTNATGLAIAIDAGTTAGVYSGTVLVDEETSGQGIDGLGILDLGTVAVAVTYAVDNYATAELVQTGGNGQMTPSGVANTYTLDLGSAYHNAADLTASLEALNAAQGPAADMLDGSFALSGDSEFTNSGFSAFANVAFGTADTSPEVALNTGTIGTFTETVVLTPTGTNASGYSGVLANETIVVVGTILPEPPPAPPPAANRDRLGRRASDDVRRAVLRLPGRGRIRPGAVHRRRQFVPGAGSDAAVQRQLDGQRDHHAGGDGRHRTGDGGARPPGRGGDQRHRRAVRRGRRDHEPGRRRVDHRDLDQHLPDQLASGEVMNVSLAGAYINVNLTLSAADGPGSVQGLLGSDSGQANDFQLADGTVIPQDNLTSSELYGAYAAAWRVTDGTSLMDYLAGQTTATFTDANFPADAVNIHDLPAAILQVRSSR